MVALVSDVVNAVINLLSQVPGVATQLYAADRIRQHVQDALFLELEEMWWPTLMSYSAPISVDQSTGLLQSSLLPAPYPNVEWRDIAAVFEGNGNRKLREVPQSVNPYQLSTGVGYITADYTTANRPFKVFPANATPSVVVWMRSRPTIPMALTDPVPFDLLLLQYDACWMYAVDDGTIPAQVNKFQVLAQNRRKMVKASYSQHPLELDPRFPAGADLFGGGDDMTYFVLDKDPLA
jgi:hypothetical protein